MRRSDLIRDLKERLGQIERPRQPDRESTFSTNIAALDEMLPRKGLAWGTLLEWLSDGEGSGAMALTLAIASRQLQESGDPLVVIDSHREFYPPAATGLGIPLEHLVLVRPESPQDALWAWEHSLRSGAAAMVLGWIEKLNDRAFRKLQLAAETGDSVGFLLRPTSCRAEPSWAEARFRVHASPLGEPSRVSGRVTDHPVCNSRTDCQSVLPTRRLHVELLYARGGASGKTIELELSDETGLVSVASRLGDSAPATRQAGA